MFPHYYLFVCTFLYISTVQFTHFLFTRNEFLNSYYVIIAACDPGIHLRRRDYYYLLILLIINKIKLDDPKVGVVRVIYPSQVGLEVIDPTATSRKVIFPLENDSKVIGLKKSDPSRVGLLELDLTPIYLVEVCPFDQLAENDYEEVIEVLRSP